MTEKPPHKLTDDCCGQSAGLMKFDEVIALLFDILSPVAGQTKVPLHKALGRVLAEDIVSPQNVPAFTNSAVDGYAYSWSEDLAKGGDLKIVAEIFAGDETLPELKPGEAARIFTGAPMPKGADSSLMQEDAVVSGDRLTLPVGVKQGANVRQAGEDLKTGDPVVLKRTRLTPAHLGAIASTGKDEIICREKLKIAVVSTGDEVIRPGISLKPGQIYDANFHLLTGLLNRPDLQVDDMGVLPDDEAVVRDKLTALGQSHDVILTSGGVSVGDADFVVKVMREEGILHSWKVAQKPGRPLAIGQIGKAVFFGLPGNPVAAYLACLLYGEPMLSILADAEWKAPQRFPLPAGFAIKSKKTGRREFQRGWIEQTDNGPVVKKFGRDGSGMISSLTKSEGLIELDENISSVSEGELVNFIPFSQFGR